MFFTPPPPPIKPTNVIVWIHGTNPEKFLPSPMARFIEKTTSLFFHGKAGLIKTSYLDVQHYPLLLAKTLAQCAPADYCQEHFYMFGWDGKLTLENRKEASGALFYALKALMLEYFEKDGCFPNLILISHSHGGNVILHMAEIVDADGFQLHIHKAILLACPVQKHTKHLIAHAMFERIYSIHSHTDMIQIIDPQGFKKLPKLTISRPLFSQRHFDSHPKLAQACVKWKNAPSWHPEDSLINDHLLRKLTTALKLLDKIKRKRGLFHIEFNLLPFVRLLPWIIKQLDHLIDHGQNCQSSSDSDIIIYL